MSEESERRDGDSSEDPKFDTSGNHRAGWVLFGGLGGMLALLVIVELLRRL
jgi:hypothetical protein